MIQDTAQAVADTAMGRAEFVGDPFEQVAAGVIFGVIVAGGVFAAVWILIRTPSRAESGGQASLTKLGVLVYGLAMSIWVWQAFAAAFLGIGSYKEVNEFGKWLAGFALVGAGGVKVGSTVLKREQIKAGRPVTNEGGGE